MKRYHYPRPGMASSYCGATNGGGLSASMANCPACFDAHARERTPSPVLALWRAGTAAFAEASAKATKDKP